MGVYVMPGLGGADLSEQHARETADVVTQISPDSVRLRTLSVPKDAPLNAEREAGEFRQLSETDTVKEVRNFVQQLIDSGCKTHLASDHVLNLLEGVEGRLP